MSSSPVHAIKQLSIRQGKDMKHENEGGREGVVGLVAP